MKFMVLLSVLFCWACCGVDHLAMAIRFYKGNPHAKNSDESLFRQLAEAEREQGENRLKMSLIYYLKGLAYERKNDMGKAEANYQKALQYNPTFVDAMIALMRIKKRLGKNAEYRKLLRSAICELETEIKNVSGDNFFSVTPIADPHFKYAVENALIPSVYNVTNSVARVDSNRIRQDLKKTLKELKSCYNIMNNGIPKNI